MLWAGTTGPTGDDPDYPPGAKIGAAVFTFFAPFISLVAALALRSSQPGEAKRASLRTWAIASGVWLGIGIVIALIAMASIAHTASTLQPSDKGPCIGGPKMGSDGVAVGHNRYRFPCEFGGSTIVNFGH
jgi:hypothetical protein